MTEEDPEVKRALANFLGFTLSKSRELDSSITQPAGVRNRNIEALVTKAANEIEARFSPSANHAPVPAPPVHDIAQMLIPYDAAPMVAPVPVAAPSPVAISDSDQLEFNFTDPNPQTKMILAEIDRLNSKLNSILSLLKNKDAETPVEKKPARKLKPKV